MRTIIMTRLLALLCGITTMININTEETIINLSKICNQTLKEVPDWQPIQDVIENIDYNEIDDVRKHMSKALLRSKMFDRFKYNGYILLVVDCYWFNSFRL